MKRLRNTKEGLRLEDGDASVVSMNRRNRVTVDINFTAGTSTIMRGD